MNGTLDFSSTQGNGSQFWLNIPLAIQQQVSPTMNIKNNFQNVNLLVAASADQGIELAHSQSPSIIILDILLPGTNGLEVLKCLKQSPITRDINIIALTTETSQKNIDDGLSAGFYAYLTKPVDLNVVTETINSASFNTH